MQARGDVLWPSHCTGNITVLVNIKVMEVNVPGWVDRWMNVSLTSFQQSFSCLGPRSDICSWMHMVLKRFLDPNFILINVHCYISVSIRCLEIALIRIEKISMLKIQQSISSCHKDVSLYQYCLSTNAKFLENST